jgi:hypothetical protein
MLSEILQGCFSKIGNLSLHIKYHLTIQEQTNKEKERREGKSRMSNSKILHFLLSEILQGGFLKIGNSSLQIIYHVAVPEQEKEKSRMSNSKVLHFCLFLKHAFRNLARMLFENWEFVLANYISYGCSQGCFSKNRNSSLQILHQLESESISFLLGQCNGFEPDQLFSLTAFLHTFVFNQYKKMTV